MRIAEAIPTIKAEIIFRRTPTGRPIEEYALENLKAAIEDEKNWGTEVVKCANCCIIQSGLLVPEGCPNCGFKGKPNELTQADIL